MMTFSTEEVFSSVIFALAYGAIFAIILSFIVVVKESLTVMLDMLKTTCGYEKIFPLPRFKGVKISYKSSAFISVIAVFLFAIGFSLLSYMSLDGQLRLYVLILSFASFYVSKIAFFDIFSRVILLALKAFFIIIALIVRVALWLPKRLYNHLNLIKNK